MARYNKENLLSSAQKEIMSVNTDLFADTTAIEKVIAVPIKNLRANPDNKFSSLEGDDWNEFVHSIKEYGIQTPILIRHIYDNGEKLTEGGESIYEIIAGHNRVKAAKELTLINVPAIIKDVDDVEATILMGITNKQRENVSDIEWGWAYRNTYEALKRDKTANLQNQGQKKAKNGNIEISTISSKGHADPSRAEGATRDIVAEKYGVGAKTVNRKIRLTYLTSPLVYLYENKKITQDVAIELSYTKDLTQDNIAGYIEDLIKQKKKMDIELAKRIRSLDDEGKLNIDNMKEYMGLNDSKGKEKTGKPKTRKIKYEVDEELFPREMNKKERQEYITSALRYIMANNIKI